MRTTVAILLLIAFIFPQLNKVWIFIDFKINQDFIIELLCINKDEPIIMCNGKCYLEDQLKKAEEKEQKEIPSNLQEEIVNNLFVTETGNSSTLPNIDQCKMKFVEHALLYSSSYIHRIFHPPKISKV